MNKQVPLKKQVVLLGLLLAVTGLLWIGHKHVGNVFAAFGPSVAKKAITEKAGRKIPVVVSRVERRADDAVIEAIATARARRFVTLYPETDGRVMQLGVRAGTRVKSGDILLKLDAQTAKLAVRLGAVKVVEAERLLARAQDLLANRVKAQANVDDARTALDRARLELDQARETLSKRAIRAPFDGVVGIPKVEVGDRVTTTTAIVTMDERSDLLVEVEVPELYLARIKDGQKIVARTPSYPAQKFEGTIEEIDSRVDPASRSVMFRAKLPNKDDLLRPGMSFAVEVTVPGKHYPAVPELALQWHKGKSFVWRIKDGKSERVDVRSIRRVNSFILVSGSLETGDLVVVEGVQRLRAGRRVVFRVPEARATSRKLR